MKHLHKKSFFTSFFFYQKHLAHKGRVSRLGSYLYYPLLAELVRAKRASKAPWVIKNGNPSSRENLVMTSAYERANAVRTDSGGGGGASRGKPHWRSKECHLFSAGFSVKKFVFVMSTNVRDVDLTF